MRDPGDQQEMPPAQPAPGGEAVAAADMTGTLGHAAAIVGVAGFFPGSASLEEFCRHLGEQHCLIGPVPGDHHCEPGLAGRHGSFIADIAGFDHRLFNISLREAQYMDPRLRLLLMSSWHALEDAGLVPGQMGDAVVDVLVASEESAYADVIGRIEMSPYTAVGSSSWSLPNRISHALGFTGQSLFINAACAGGSVALHRALRALRSGEADYVLVGAANLLYGAAASLTYRAQEALGILADGDGCRPFQPEARGFLPAEAVVTVLLRRYQDALREGDRVHGLLLGSHVNHGGGRVSSSAPDARAQAAAMLQACRDAQVDPGTVTYVEAHGACTQLGDAEEIKAFRELEAALDRTAPGEARAACQISSLKPNVGHANSASGLLSLIRALYGMETGRRLGVRGFAGLSELIDLEGSRYYISAENRDWEPLQREGRPLPRRAAINNFNAGGVNAHLIVQEAPGRPPDVAPADADEGGTWFLALSAAQESQLLPLAQSLLDAIEAGRIAGCEALETASIMTRRALRHRLVFRHEGLRSLTDKLRKYLKSGGRGGYFLKSGTEGRGRLAACFRGSPALIQALHEQGDRRVLFELWCDGYEEPLRGYLARRGRTRCELPLYPFLREPVWPEGGMAPAGSGAEPVVQAAGAARGPAADPGAAQVLQTGAGGAGAPQEGGSTLERLQSDLKRLAAQVLKASEPGALPAHESFESLGFDSIGLRELAGRLTGRLGVGIAPTVFFGHPTLARLADHLLERHGSLIESLYAAAGGERVQALPAAAVQPGPAEPAALPRLAPLQEPIAIIGMSGRFPQADDIHAMWEVLAAGRDAVGTLAQRAAEWGDPELATQRCGLIEGVAEFDALFFEISPREAEAMDPRQRLLLQEAFRALEDAAYGRAQLDRAPVAVFVGVEPGQYQSVTGKQDSVTDNSDSVLAGRIAYFLDLTGPNMAINTACSSGLVAVHQACLSLRQRECGTALAAAVNLMVVPGPFKAMRASGMLSADGRCRAFDRRAAGMVPAEAVVVLVLKRLEEARADGDPIHAVIRGSGVNYDGRTNGITAPSGVSQARLLRSVYDRCAVPVEEIEYVVAHGTGTVLGDPIEVQALCDAFGAAGERRQYCALTSSKSNFGHSFAASGLVSLVCLVQAMRHQLIPRSLHCDELNEHVIWAASPFYVNTSARPWPARARPRLGAVSAFGVSGTNAHVVLESHDAEPEPAAEPPACLLVLSAKNARALGRRVQDLIRFLESARGAAVSLAAVSHTCLAGRLHHRHRCAVVAHDRDSALAALRQCATPEGAGLRGEVPRELIGEEALASHGRELLRKADSLRAEPGAYAEVLRELAVLYCKGCEPDWQALFGARPPPRVHLPTYPFAKDEHWMRATPAARPGSAPAVLHPLVHENTSVLEEQRFTSRFSGTEPFFTDHVLEGRRVLPGVAYLEMARAAFLRSQGEGCDPAAPILLERVTWVRPIVAGDTPLAVHTVLLPAEDDGVAFEICTDRGDERIVHCQGLIALGEPRSDGPPGLRLPQLEQACAQRSLSVTECYERFAGMGTVYGPAHRGLRSLHVGDQQVLAAVEIPSAQVEGADAYGLHPSLLDSALQAGIGLSAQGMPVQPLAPFAVQAVEIFAAGPRHGWAWLRPSATDAPERGVRRLDVDVCDEAGRVFVRLRAFSARVLTEAGARGAVRLAPAPRPLQHARPAMPVGTVLLRPSWQPARTAGGTGAWQGPRRVLLCGWSQEFAGELGARLACPCQSLAADGDVAERFAVYAEGLLSCIKELLSGQPRLPVLVQVVVAEPAGGMRGLMGLLKTAHLENPRIVGQLLEVPAEENVADLLAQLRNEPGAAGDEVRYA